MFKNCMKKTPTFKKNFFKKNKFENLLKNIYDISDNKKLF